MTKRTPPEAPTPDLPRGATRRAGRASFAGGLAWVLFAGLACAQQPQLLENERAFAFSARPLDASTVEARFAIADGYYLYRDKLRFTVEPGAPAAAPTLPPGKIKQDEYFGTVETYRGKLVVSVALPAPSPGTAVTVKAQSQGCADIGVCYPPQQQQVVLTMPLAGKGPGSPVEAAPAKKTWFK